MAIRMLLCLLLVSFLSGCAGFMSQYDSCKTDCASTYADCVKSAPQGGSERASAEYNCRQSQDVCLNYCDSTFKTVPKPEPSWRGKWPPDWP